MLPNTAAMVVGRVVNSVVQRQVKYVTPVSAAAATGLVAQVYAQVGAEMGIVVPPVLVHSPAPELLAAYWMLLREPLLPQSRVDRAAKEAVATAVSVANICPYCVDMHSVGMYDLATEHDAEAIVADRVDELRDPHIREVAAWARVAHQPDEPLARTPPFPPADAPELVGVVVSVHYLTRMVNVFLPNFLLPPGLTPVARRRFKRGVSLVLRPTLRDRRPPGMSTPFLPPAPAADLGWAAGNPAIEEAATRAYAAFEAAGQRSLSPAVREVVLSRLDGWRGEETELSRRWCERLIRHLPDDEAAAARLALLTALASYQVDDEVVAEFRAHHHGDRVLVEAAAWASFAAARVIGSRYSAI
jgi:alkylhydroperoxidase family enzyme